MKYICQLIVLSFTRENIHVQWLNCEYFYAIAYERFNLAEKRPLLR